MRREGKAHQLMLLKAPAGAGGEANISSPIVQIDVIRDVERP